jgi:hypothetical protein
MLVCCFMFMVGNSFWHHRAGREGLERSYGPGASGRTSSCIELLRAGLNWPTSLVLEDVIKKGERWE